MRKIIVVSSIILLALSSASWAAKPVKNKKKDGRSDYTSEQRAAFHKQAIEVCRKNYGGILVRAEIDYKRKRFICWTN